MNNSGWGKEVLRLLSNNKNGLSLSRLARELRVTPEEKIWLRKNIKTLEAQGLILKLRKRYFLRPRSNIIHGRFTASARGFGFVIPEEDFLGDIYVPARFAGGALHGDRVEVQYKEPGRKGKPEGKIVRILQKGKNSLLGLCRVRSGQVFFLAFAAVSSEEIPIDCTGHPLPKSGDVVRVHRDTMCLEEILGSMDQPGVDTRIIIERYDLEEDFSADALEEANKIPDSPVPDQKEGRVDYTGWQTITIDGDNAQDFDDAVSIKLQANGHFLLGVHIADVAEYVQEGTSLDRNAKLRGTSVYFPDLTIPMLPEKLSNGICSLRPREEKLTLSVILEVDPRGCVQNVDIHPSSIRTVERMTYSSVMKIIEGDAAERKRFAFLVEDLFHMNDLAQLLREKRIKEGGLDFDLTEPELVYREGSLFSIVPTETNQAHHIIEEFMVLANEMVARFLASRDIPLIFRVHPKPLPADLSSLRDLLAHFGINLPATKTMGSKDLQSVLENIRGKPEEKFVTFRVLRSLRLAAYSDENYGHYGLAKEEYAHFTSPIRRYPDLVVHRILKRFWRGDKIDGRELAAMALQCSQQERAAEEAERDLVEWRIYRFLKDRLGDEFGGVIVDFTKAGMIVELDDFFVSGLIPFGDLGNDYFYKKTEKMLSGKKTGKSFELGSHLRVVLVSVDPIFRRMNLMLSERAAIGGQF
jgi:ribonuclease R